MGKRRQVCLALLAAVILGFGVLCVASPGVAETVTYGYDSLGRLTSVQVAGAGRIIYAYDAAGNLVSVTRVGAKSADAGGATTAGSTDMAVNEVEKESGVLDTARSGTDMSDHEGAGADDPGGMVAALHSGRH